MKANIEPLKQPHHAVFFCLQTHS